MDKVEATATVRDFDPISGSIPATKVEITVSCRWVRDGWNRYGFFFSRGLRRVVDAFLLFGRHSSEISYYFNTSEPNHRTTCWHF